MRITYQGLNIMEPIQGEIKADAFAVSLLNANEVQETLSPEEVVAQNQYKIDSEEILSKLKVEKDPKVQEELLAQLAELDAKERDRLNQKVTENLVEQYEQEQEATSNKTMIGAGIVIVIFIVIIGFMIFNKKRKAKGESI